MRKERPDSIRKKLEPVESYKSSQIIKKKSESDQKERLTSKTLNLKNKSDVLMEKYGGLFREFDDIRKGS